MPSYSNGSQYNTRSRAKTKNNTITRDQFQTPKRRLIFAGIKTRRSRNTNINTAILTDPGNYNSTMGSPESTKREIEEEWRRLRAAQARLEQEKAQLEQLRLEQLQNEEARRRAEDQNNEARIVRENARARDDAGDRLVDGLVNHFQYLNVNVKIPKFTDESNPKAFIDDVERYLKYKNIHINHQMFVIDSWLEGRLKIWYDINQERLTTFEVFKAAFLDEFYSTPVKVHFKNQWLARKYKQKDGTMQAYFYRQVRDAGYFDPPLTPYEVNYSIIKQFSTRIQIALATLNYSDTKLVAQVLTQLDNTQSECEPEKNKDFRLINTNGNSNGNSYQNNNSFRQNRVNSINTRYGKNSGNNNRNWNTSYNQGQSANNSQQFFEQMPDTRYPPPNYQYINNLPNNTSDSDQQKSSHLNAV